jgi:hypothetical protein
MRLRSLDLIEYRFVVELAFNFVGVEFALYFRSHLIVAAAKATKPETSGSHCARQFVWAYDDKRHDKDKHKFHG